MVLQMRSTLHYTSILHYSTTIPSTGLDTLVRYPAELNISGPGSRGPMPTTEHPVSTHSGTFLASCLALSTPGVASVG